MASPGTWIPDNINQRTSSQSAETEGLYVEEPTTKYGAHPCVESYDNCTIKYIRFAEDTDMETLHKLLFDEWHIFEPCAVLSLLKPSVPEPDSPKRKVLINALSELIDNLSLKDDGPSPKLYRRVWILSDGWLPKSSVCESSILLREVAENCRCDVVILVCVFWKETRMGTPEQLSQQMESFGCHRDGVSDNIKNEKVCTYVMLVDNGTGNNHKGAESRSNFLHQLLTSFQNRSSGFIPAVVLAYAGDSFTYKEIERSVTENVPVILFKTSEIVSKSLHMAAFFTAIEETKAVSRRSVALSKNTRKIVQIAFNVQKTLKKTLKQRQSAIGISVEALSRVTRLCLELHNMLTVVDLEAEDRENIIYDFARAIVKGRSTKDILQFCENFLSYSLFDGALTAMKESFKKDDRKREKYLRRLLVDMMTLEKTECLDVLIESNLANVDEDFILQLYEKTTDDIQSDNKLKDDVSAILAKKMKMSAIGKKRNTCGFQALLNEIKALVVDRCIPEGCKIEGDPRMNGPSAAITTHLFIWALLTNRMSLAMVFWRTGEDHVVSALIAGRWMDLMAQSLLSGEERTILQENAIMFKRAASGTLDMCYNEDQEICMELLEQKQTKNTWKVNPLQLSFRSASRIIFQTEALEYYASWKWHGNLKMSSWKIFLYAIFFFLSPLLFLGGSKCTSSQTQTGLKRRLKDFFGCPLVKLVFQLEMYLVFIGLYTHLLTAVLAPQFSWSLEPLVIIWVFAFIIEESYQIYESRSELSNYIRDPWNVLDLMCIVGFIVGYILRSIPTTFTYGRLFLCLNFLCFTWRVLQAFTFLKQVGPLLYMAFKMVQDILSFMAIMIVAIVSYAIATEALLYPNTVWQAGKIFPGHLKSIWVAFGEFGLDEVTGEKCADDASSCPSSIGKTWVPIIMVFYIIAINVLLLNLLIAQLNNTYADVQTKVRKIWVWQNCKLVLEYVVKPPVPVPFTIIWRLVVGPILWVRDKIPRRVQDRDSPTRDSQCLGETNPAENDQQGNPLMNSKSISEKKAAEELEQSLEKEEEFKSFERRNAEVYVVEKLKNA